MNDVAILMMTAISDLLYPSDEIGLFNSITSGFNNENLKLTGNIFEGVERSKRGSIERWILIALLNNTYSVGLAAFIVMDCGVDGEDVNGEAQRKSGGE